MSCRNELWLSCGQHKSKSQLLCVLIPFPHSVSKERPLVFNANFFSVPLPHLVDHNAKDFRLKAAFVTCISCILVYSVWWCGVNNDMDVSPCTRSRHCLSLSSCLCQVMSSRPLSLQFIWLFPHFISGLIWVVTSVRLQTCGGLSSGSWCYFFGCLQV